MLTKPLFITYCTLISIHLLLSVSKIESRIIQLKTKDHLLSKPEANTLIKSNLRSIPERYRSSLKTSGLLSLTEDYYLQRANISLGSPPQEVEIAVYLFDFAGVSVVNLTYGCVPTNMNDFDESLGKFREKYKNACKQNGFNSSASGTFKDLNRTFENEYGKAVMATEHFNFSGIPLNNLTFGLVTEYKAPIKDAPLGGYISLYPDVARSLQRMLGSVPSIWPALLDQLDRPIFTLWSNRSFGCSCENGGSLITLGGIDRQNCRGDWAYADQLDRNIAFHVESAEAEVNDQWTSLYLDATAVIIDYFDGMAASRNLLYLIGNTTNAVYDANLEKYFVDCQLRTAMRLVMLRIGTDKQALDLGGMELIAQDDSVGKCYLVVTAIVDSAYGQNLIWLGRRFLNNHCLAYNFELKQFGFNYIPHRIDDSDSSTGIRAFDYP
ncbi:eukaryotic aspartyl protease domain-containing protein [Ditylenchus destructor]|uniref:Eukaryotic aspartyl protease domain-containing protein n=1 Tax=Ditylenchus destructor TaxID=166010 RepID=A0AAD4N0Y0_9BILA|nr:eukaryotic aspartyl protease domain-containing protein [Ditylenchus destructor]